MKTNNQNKGFTLIELLVVIAIIGLVASIVVISLGESREKARNARRMADVGQMASILALYQNACNSYPQTGPIKLQSDFSLFTGTATDCGNNSGVAPNGGIGTVQVGPVYLGRFESSPTPPDNGDLPVGEECSATNGSFLWNDYVYTSTSPDKYTISFCISEPTGGKAAGRHTLTESGIH